MFHKKLSNEAGMAMVVALTVTLLTTVLASSYMSITISENRHSMRKKHKAVTQPAFTL